MAKKSSGLAWAVGLATVAVAGIGIAIYEKTKGAPATGTPGSTTSTTATAPVSYPTSSTPANSFPLPTTAANGATITANWSGNNVDQLVSKAVQLAQLGHPAEGAIWARSALLSNPSQVQVATLSSVGYKVS